MDRFRIRREQIYALDTQETTDSEVQRVQVFIQSNSSKASRLGAQQCLARIGLTVSTERRLGPLK